MSSKFCISENRPSSVSSYKKAGINSNCEDALLGDLGEAKTVLNLAQATLNRLANTMTEEDERIVFLKNPEKREISTAWETLQED